MPTNEEKNWWPWAVCGILFLATFLNYMDRQALAITLPLLKTKFNIAETRIGIIEGCFGYAFAFGSLLFGWLADRIGPRLLYPAVLAGWSIAGIATALAGQEWVTSMLQSASDEPGTGVYRWLLICRVVLGVCEAGHWPCALLTVRAVMLARQRTLGNGILQAGASIGAMVIPVYIEAAERAGQSWEFPFWSIGLAGLFWIPAWFMLVGRRDLGVVRVGESDAATSSTSITSSSEERTSDAEISTNTHASVDRNVFVRKLIVLALIVSTLTISWQFLRVWLTLYLQDYHKFTQLQTRWLNSGYFIAADIGCILSGLLVSALVARGLTVHRSRATGFLVFALLTACGAIVPYAGNGTLMVGLLFVAGAGILGLHPFYYSLTQDISAKRMGSLSGALAAFGWVVSATSQIFLGQHIQESKSYELGLLMVGLAPMIGFAALLFLWPRDQAK